MANLFLEKLKKGMGIEIPDEDTEDDNDINKKKKTVAKKTKKTTAKKMKEPKEKIEEEIEETEDPEEEIEEETEEIEEEEEPMVAEKIEEDEEEEEEEDEKIEEDDETEEDDEESKIEINESKPRVNKKIILKTKKMSPDEIKEEEEKEDWLVPEGQLSVDVYQTKEDLVIQSAIAGIRPDILDISLEGDVVTIRGKREKPDNNEEGEYFTQECYWGQFSRDVILPVDVDPNRVKAEMKDGILTIRIPKIFREKKRKIMVKKMNE